ncbi:MAG: PCMD domain-containing protein, partial [Muribaculaceae bacterium]|nr:PCMD domain-containing protein [Muribaculaceae bacterium]
KSMMIESVGWDPDGEAIPDWVPQPGSGAVRHSEAVPHVSHRSAGRLFLGKYTFNSSTMTEVYNEGVPFSSRPSSLNGFYKYSPDAGDQTDHGKVTIELVRRDATTTETIIAAGEYVFGSCPDFKSFNVPLVYQRYDLHPTHLKIMFISSVEADEVPIDDDNVPVTPNTEKGAYIGSILWIDNLSFTY